MSGRETVLVHPDGPAITVTAGTVDTFVALPSGGTIPLATVSAPCLIVAPATGPGVRVVPRIGATMSAVTGDVPVADAALAAFRTALAQAAPAEFRASSTAASLDLLPTVLASLIGVLIDQHAARGRDLAAAQRTQDTESSETAYRNAALAVTSPGTTDTVCDWDPLLSVVRAVARVEGCTVRAKPTRLRDRDPVARLHRIARSSDFGVRPIQLADNWQQPRVHALVGFQSTDSGRQAVALLPTATGYGLSTGAAAQPRRINDETARSLEPVAYQLQPRLNRLERAHTHELIRLATHKSWRDWTLVALLGLAVAILGLLTPVLTSVILGTLIPAGELGLVGQAGVALVIAAFVAGVFTYVQYRAISRFTQRTLERGQNALWDRLLSLPVSFFRRYSSGDLAMRAMALDWLAQIVNAQVIGTFLAAAFSLVNVFLMLWYDVWLGVAGLCFLILTLGATWWVVVITQRLYRESLSCQLDATSWVVQLLVGIGKIRLAGAESRVGSRYVELLRRQVAAGARMTTVMGRLFSWLAFAGAASLAVFAALILSRSGSAGPDISGPTYLAFSAAFGASFA
ncbi:MAG: ABC transporter transmembrane domain-containing protein, partial [Actinomycetes bacterium]